MAGSEPVGRWLVRAAAPVGQGLRLPTSMAVASAAAAAWAEPGFRQELSATERLGHRDELEVVRRRMERDLQTPCVVSFFRSLFAMVKLPKVTRSAPSRPDDDLAIPNEASACPAGFWGANRSVRVVVTVDDKVGTAAAASAVHVAANAPSGVVRFEVKRG